MELVKGLIELCLGLIELSGLSAELVSDSLLLLPIQIPAVQAFFPFFQQRQAYTAQYNLMLARVFFGGV